MSDLYFCPTVGEIESAGGGGFKNGTCCSHPELHFFIGYSTPAIDAISRYLSDQAIKAYAENKVGHRWAETIHTGDDGLLHLPVYAADGTEAEGLVCSREEAVVLQAMVTDYLAECDSTCDDDCDVACHEAHAVPHKRHHPIGEHPSRGTALDYVTQAVARFDLDNTVGVEYPMPGPDHEFWPLWRASARNAITAYNSYIERTGHRYLSTGCRHGEHGYCQSNTGSQGQKKPAECKFCGAKCVCSCHLPGEVTVEDRTVNPKALPLRPLVTGSDTQEWCYADPPGGMGAEWTGEDGRKGVWGDCDCTKPLDHDGDHACEPCTRRYGAPTWPRTTDPTDEEKTA